MIELSDMFNVSAIIQDIRSTDPIIIAALGTAFLVVCAWSASIFMSRRSERADGRKRRGRVRRSAAAPPRVTQDNLGPLVESVPFANRQILGDDLARVIERHRNKRFQAFVVVTRTNVNPFTFAFLYQALRAQSRPIGEVHEFQVAVRDANEILRACIAKQPQA